MGMEKWVKQTIARKMCSMNSSKNLFMLVMHRKVLNSVDYMTFNFIHFCIWIFYTTHI